MHSGLRSVAISLGTACPCACCSLELECCPKGPHLGLVMCTLGKLQNIEEMRHVWSSSSHSGHALEGDYGTAASSSSFLSLLAMMWADFVPYTSLPRHTVPKAMGTHWLYSNNKLKFQVLCVSCTVFRFLVMMFCAWYKLWRRHWYNTEIISRNSHIHFM